jgi:hypothetical protein
MDKIQVRPSGHGCKPCIALIQSRNIVQAELCAFSQHTLPIISRVQVALCRKGARRGHRNYENQPMKKLAHD